MKKENRQTVLVFSIWLVVILAGFLTLYITVRRYNDQIRTLTFTSADAEQENVTADAAVTIRPRGGKTDSWVKNVKASGRKETSYTGVIYDIRLSNHTEHPLNDWKLKVTIPDKCYINNAWCGRLEFHQHVSSGEKMQTLDLRKCVEEKTDYKIDAWMADNDLMIPMEKGDYFIYEPSASAKETVIQAASENAEEAPYIEAGFIAYHKTADASGVMEFPDAVLTYHLNMKMMDSEFFWVLNVTAFLWVVAVLICILVAVKTRQLVQRTQKDARIIKQAMTTFMGFIDAKDPSTNGHSRRVAAYARKIAKRYGMTEEEIQNIYYMGLMHDCGKIRIPDEVLCKPGKLTDEEYAIMKTHTTEGANFLKDFTSIPQIREAALYHHERYDGRGYPEGLAGEEIPLVARILCVADSFDAMNSNRCYRARLSKEDIIDEIRDNRGTQFDPMVADCMLELLKDGTITFDAE